MVFVIYIYIYIFKCKGRFKKKISKIYFEKSRSLLTPSAPTSSKQGETKCLRPKGTLGPPNTAKAMKALQQQNHPIQPQLDKALSSTKKNKKSC